VSLDVGTLGRLLAFAALVAATEFYALVIHRRAARRRTEERDAARTAEVREALPITPMRRAFGIEADQHPSSRWVARWRAMSGSGSGGEGASPDDPDQSEVETR
jgi:hypothetical protein